MENQHRNEIEIDLVELYYYLRKKLWIVAVVAMVCAVLGYGYTTFFMDTQYTARTRIYVLNRSDETRVSYSDFQISNVLLEDYVVLITGQNVTKEVVKEMNLNMTAAQLESMISVSAPSDTRVIQISVTDTDPQRAADIANCVREIASVQIKEIMDVDAVNLVYEADVPQYKSGPNVRRNAILAAALGFLVSVAVLIVVHLVDDTIRTEEDVEHYLGLSVMGVIPDSVEISAMGTKSTTGSGTSAKSTGSARKQPAEKSQAKKN